MTKYDYREAVKDDLIDLINDEFVKRLDAGEFDNLDDFREELNDAAWIDDSVTGNGSGSYTFSTWKAEENLCHNMDLLAEALEDFGDGKLPITPSPVPPSSGSVSADQTAPG